MESINLPSLLRRTHGVDCVKDRDDFTSPSWSRMNGIKKEGKEEESGLIQLSRHPCEGRCSGVSWRQVRFPWLFESFGFEGLQVVRWFRGLSSLLSLLSSLSRSPSLLLPLPGVPRFSRVCDPLPRSPFRSHPVLLPQHTGPPRYRDRSRGIESE